MKKPKFIIPTKPWRVEEWLIDIKTQTASSAVFDGDDKIVCGSTAMRVNAEGIIAHRVIISAVNKYIRNPTVDILNTNIVPVWAHITGNDYSYVEVISTKTRICRSEFFRHPTAYEIGLHAFITDVVNHYLFTFEAYRSRD